MGFIKDFKAFALKGNVLDLAVGVIIGGAFGKIVTALVDDVIMPFIGLAGVGKFDDRFTVLSPGKDGSTSFATLDAAKKAGANVFAYGHFIQSIVDFLITALCIFVAVRAIARLYKKKDETPAAPAMPTKSEELLTEIRDALKGRAV